jgi:carbonic anhydrase
MTTLAQGQLEHIERMSSRELVDRLRDGRSTGAAFFTCSEMGGDVPYVPHQPAESIFVWQNLGNCLADDAVLAHLVRSEKISNIIIYGHYPCALIDLTFDLDPAAARMSDETLAWLNQQVSGVKRSIAKQFGLSRDVHVMRKASEEHVLWQLAKVSSLLRDCTASKQEVSLHGWLWAGGELLCFDPQKRTFIPTCEE